jgi:UDPglucose--hexose-1-phosphate uridylyltransferase
MFKNFGPLGGASLEHPHSQLLALPDVPFERRMQLEKCRQWRESQGSCLFCALLQHEQADACRMLVTTPRFLAFCPFASRFPFQTWIMRREHGPAFEDADTGELRELGECVRKVLTAQRQVLGSVGYNLILQSTPFDTAERNHYHWYVETFPRVSITAGFEWGSGDFINTTAPESAAESLRRGLAGENCDPGDFSSWKN